MFLYKINFIVIMSANDDITEVNNRRIIINVIVLVGVLMIIYYYAIPYLNENGSDENYAPNRERTDPQSDWNIIEEIRAIRARQQKNIGKMSTRNYGI